MIADEVFPGLCYRNIKNRKLYYVMTLAKHSETHEKMVVYFQTQGRRQVIPLNPNVFVRPYDLFRQKFEESD